MKYLWAWILVFVSIICLLSHFQKMWMVLKFIKRFPSSCDHCTINPKCDIFQEFFFFFFQLQKIQVWFFDFDFFSTTPDKILTLVLPQYSNLKSSVWCFSTGWKRPRASVISLSICNWWTTAFLNFQKWGNYPIYFHLFDFKVIDILNSVFAWWN